jgi:hypothetical protein
MHLLYLTAASFRPSSAFSLAPVNFEMSVSILTADAAPRLLKHSANTDRRGKHNFVGVLPLWGPLQSVFLLMGVQLEGLMALVNSPAGDWCRWG